VGGSRGTAAPSYFGQYSFRFSGVFCEAQVFLLLLDCARVVLVIYTSGYWEKRINKGKIESVRPPRLGLLVESEEYISQLLWDTIMMIEIGLSQFL